MIGDTDHTVITKKKDINFIKKLAVSATMIDINGRIYKPRPVAVESAFLTLEMSKYARLVENFDGSYSIYVVSGHRFDLKLA